MLQPLSNGQVSLLNIFLSEQVKGKEEINFQVKSGDNAREQQTTL